LNSLVRLHCMLVKGGPRTAKTQLLSADLTSLYFCLSTGHRDGDSIAKPGRRTQLRDFEFKVQPDSQPTTSHRPKVPDPWFLPLILDFVT
jgi:hypothetical protein